MSILFYFLFDPTGGQTTDFPPSERHRYPLHHRGGPEMDKESIYGKHKCGDKHESPSIIIND